MRSKKRNIITILILTFLCTIIFLPKIYAESYKEYTARITATAGLNVRKSATTNSEIIKTLSYNSTIKYTDNDVYQVENSTCQTWIYVKSEGGYICKDYTIDIDDSVENDISKMTDEEFDAYLDSQGFDDTYKESLKILHQKYPSWVFKGIKTDRDWSSTVAEESQTGFSTYYIDAIRESAGQEAYLSTESYYDWAINMFYGYDGRFFLANEKTVAYFLDPRNYLTESNVFVFESLYFNETFQEKEKIATIIKTNEYTDLIYEAGQKYNYSPLAVAIKIRQEGTLNNRATNGITEVRCSTSSTGPKYDPNGTLYLAPLYNFFNIGATSSPTNADLNGLCYAATTNDTYMRPWNTKQKAIEGGIKWISDQYVNVGQYTNYFQKFNVATPNTQIWHQYMTNLEDPKSQSSILYNLYVNNDMIHSPFVFYIPIFNNMPEKTELPKTGNPNNWLTSLNININGTTSSVSNFSGDTTSYTITVPSTISNVTINSTTVAKTSYVSIDGDESKLKTSAKQVALKTNENIFNIVVTAGNGDIKTYTLNIIREEATGDEPTIEELLNQTDLNYTDEYISGISFGTGTTTLTNSLLEINNFATIQVTNNKDVVKTTGALGTGDKIAITSNQETKTYSIIIFGDLNSDGEISNVDLLTVQKHIWKDTNLTGAYFKAADIDKDGNITNADLLRIQKHIWKDSIIGQN